MAELEIMSALLSNIRAMLPIKKAAVKIELHGSHRGDADNLAGSCLDALVSAGVLLDDRLSCVPRLVVEHNPMGDRGVWIEVMPLILCETS